MTIYDELVARGLIAQVTDEEEIKEIISGLEDKSVPAVMKHFKANYAGKVDMRLVGTVLKSL